MHCIEQLSDMPVQACKSNNYEKDICKLIFSFGSITADRR